MYLDQKVSLIFPAYNEAKNIRVAIQDFDQTGVVDEIVSEPLGGAHHNPELAISTLSDSVSKSLESLLPLDPGVLRARRRDKFVEMGRIALN